MRRIETSHPDVFLIEPEPFGDARGFFMETYHEKKFQELGISIKFVQDNHSKSARNILRGLHYQLKHAQAKLCRVVSGEVWDVAVDVRRGSPYFGKWVGALLSAENKRQIFIPAGFAHGFAVLSASAEFLYKCSDFYDPADERGVLWSDPKLGIDWGVENPILSSKDERNPRLENVPEEQLPQYAGDNGPGAAQIHRPRVLSLGKQPAVLQSRNQILERAGYEVTSAGSLDEARDLLSSRIFDAAIVGYTFSKNEKQSLIRLIENEFNIPVLLLYLKPADMDIPATAHANAIHEESSLLASIAALLKSRK